MQKCWTKAIPLSGMLRWKRTAGRRNQPSPQLREEERRLSFNRSHHLCYHSGFSPTNVFFSLNVSSVFTKHVRFAVSWISWSWVSSPLGGGKGLWPKPKRGTTPAGEKSQMKSFRNIYIISLSGDQGWDGGWRPSEPWPSLPSGDEPSQSGL